MRVSLCFEIPKLVARVAAIHPTPVARQILGKAVARLHATRARQTRDTVGRLPREPAGSAQGRSQSTASGYHTFPSSTIQVSYNERGRRIWAYCLLILASDTGG